MNKFIQILIQEQIWLSQNQLKRYFQNLCQLKYYHFLHPCVKFENFYSSKAEH